MYYPITFVRRDPRVWIMAPVIVAQVFNSEIKQFLSTYSNPFVAGVFPDFLSSVIYTTQYSITMGPLKAHRNGDEDGKGLQKLFFENAVSPTINNFLSFDQIHENFKGVASSSSKILVGFTFSSSMFLVKSMQVLRSNAFGSGEVDYNSRDFYSLVKPVVKHTPILMCKLYFLPSNIALPYGQEFIVNSACNMLGELVEGVVKLAYSYGFEEKVDLYKLDEFISDVVYSMYKTVHHRLEEAMESSVKGGMSNIGGSFSDFALIKSFALKIANPEFQEQILEMFPVHYYVGGTIRRFLSKLFNAVSEKLIMFDSANEHSLQKQVAPDKALVMHLGGQAYCKDNGEVCLIEVPCIYYSRDYPKTSMYRESSTSPVSGILDSLVGADATSMLNG